MTAHELEIASSYEGFNWYSRADPHHISPEINPFNIIDDVINVLYWCLHVTSGVHPTTVHDGPQPQYQYSCTLSITSALDLVGGQRHAPAALIPEMTRCPLYRRLGGSQDRLDVCGIYPLPPVFDLLTVASRYTACAIPVRKSRHKVTDIFVHLLPNLSFVNRFSSKSPMAVQVTLPLRYLALQTNGRHGEFSSCFSRP